MNSKINKDLGKQFIYWQYLYEGMKTMSPVIDYQDDFMATPRY